MSKTRLYNRLAKKYKVKDWFLLPSHTMINSNNEICSVQMVKNIEDLFSLGKNKYVYIYHGRLNSYPYKGIGGFVTNEEQR
jgi:hypothetical protein